MKRHSKEHRIGLAQRYHAALRQHLRRGPGASARSAEELGRKALAAGLGTMDLAWIHGQSLAALASPSTHPGMRNGMLRRAQTFFAGAITPIEETHCAAMESNVRLSQLNQAMGLRTVDQDALSRQLKREIARRTAAEKALSRSEEHYGLVLEQSRRMQERLRHLSHQILFAQEEERKEISRQLHDEITQTLTGINVHLATLKMEAAVNTKGLKKKITSTQRLVEKSMKTVHRFARELRPMLLDDLGLIPALRSYLRDLAKRTGLRVYFASFTAGRFEGLDNVRRTVLYRVAQEALTNVARHAHASEVRVGLRRLRGAIRMDIKDNGRSFQAQRMLSATNRKRLGLLCMRERVEMVGGTFTIESKPGQGTTIRAEVPFGNGIRA